MAKSTTRRLYRFCYALMIIFALFAIPWFDPAGQAPELLYGLPLWVVRAIGCSLMVALLNVLAWYLRYRIAGQADDT